MGARTGLPAGSFRKHTNVIVFRHICPVPAELLCSTQRMLITTPAGPLVVVVYVPQDDATADALAALHRSLPEEACRRLAPWPDTPEPATAY